MNGANADEVLVKNLPAAAGALVLSTQSHWLRSWNNNSTLHVCRLISAAPASCGETGREREKKEITLVLIQKGGSQFCFGSPRGHPQRLWLVIETCSRDLLAVLESKQVEINDIVALLQTL